MRIGMVLEKNFPPDIRVEKEVRALLAAGHKVYLLAYARDVNEPTEENVEGVLVRRIPGLTSLSRYWNLLRFSLTFKNRYWAAQIKRYARDFEIDVLHVHDLPLVGTGILIGRRLGIPVIADLHENYPATLEVSYGSKHSLKAWLVFNPKRWTAYERWAVWNADHVIVVVEEAKQRLKEQHGFPAEKITVLMNVEDVNYFQSIDIDSNILTRYRDAFLVSYIGGGDLHRGLDTAIRSIAYLRGVIPEVNLLIVGPSYIERNSFQALAEAEGLKDLVEIIGWQPFHKVPSYIQASEICLVPHQQDPQTDNTMPHKLIQYMLMGKPVIVSSCRPLKRIVEETGSGLVFRAGDAQDLAEKIISLYRDQALRKRCGQRGQEAILDRYNWRVESKRLVDLYSIIASHG